MTCRALICVDCTELTGGAVKTVAVFRPCLDKGRGRVGWRSWAGVLKPWAIFVVVAALIAALIGEFG